MSTIKLTPKVATVPTSKALHFFNEAVSGLFNQSIFLHCEKQVNDDEIMMSKSGSDAYYNLIIYLLTLTPDDQKCAEPFNIALQANSPELYKQGIRLGFYREIPSRQEEVSTDDRLHNQEV